MASTLKENKYITALLVITLVFIGLTFSNIPGPGVSTSVQTIDGVIFDFADYTALNKEQIGMFNYFDGLITDRALNSWEDWYADGPYTGMRHYMTAFTMYVLSAFFESTPGYRTSLYEEAANTLVKRMNTTIDDFGNDSIEYWEWGRTSYPLYYYPDPDNPADLYVGGFRGPTNIMWTGHFALMEALFERNFNTGEFTDELTWFVEDWETSLTTDGYGNPQDGGIWTNGLIPCEPFVSFPNCNSIPIFATDLFDNMYGSSYMDTGMWDVGLDYINNEMQDEYGLFLPSVAVSPHLGSDEPLDSYPRISEGSSSYITSWTMLFLESLQEDETVSDYPALLDAYSLDVAGDQMYMMGSYLRPGSFTDTDTILGSLFTLALANQRGDLQTVQRLRNFWLDPCNKVWSADGRAFHYEGGAAALSRFLEPVLTGLGTWGTLPVYMRDLAEARPAGFWDWPYISAADDDSIWVYQAEWDSVKSGFVLNIQVDQEATITFSNFDDAPTAYSMGSIFAELTSAGGNHILTLAPGSYHLVIK